MKKHLQSVLLACALTFVGASVTFAQSLVKGRIVDESGAPLIGASVTIPGTNQGISTDANGAFSLKVNAKSNLIEIAFIGYDSQSVELNGKSDIGTIKLKEDQMVLQDVVVTQSVAVQRKTPVAISTISTADIQEKLGSQEFPEMLKSTPGVYVTKDGGGYGDSKIRMRGFTQANVAVMVNGVPVNDMEWGGVYWSNWAGLSDVTRSMQSQRGLGATKISSPSVGGSINIVTNGIDAKRGGTVNMGVGNDGLQEMSFSIASGLNDNGWAFSVLGGKRWGDGYIQGTEFDGYSYFVNVSKRINIHHQLSLTAFGAPQTHNKRSNGLSIAEWDKAANYMGNDSKYQYNPSFGYDKYGRAMTGNKNTYHKPQISLNHQWQIDHKSSLSSVLYVSIGEGHGQTGQGFTSDDRRAWGGSADYGITINQAFRNPDGTFAYDQVQELNETTPGSARMILANSVNSHKWFGGISTYTNELNDNLELSAGVDVRYYVGTHTNEIEDLFGGKYFIDSASRGNVKAENNAAAVSSAWNNEKLGVGDVVYRDYDGLINQEGGFAQLEWSNDNATAFVSGSLSNTGYKRVDRFYYDAEHGTSDYISFWGYTAKAGFNYNINKHHNVFVNGGYISRAPFFSGGVFLQSTTSNVINPEAVNEKVASAEVGYGFRSQGFSLNVNGYYTKWMDKTTTRSKTMENGDVARLNMSGVDARHMGVELDFNYRPATWVSVNGMLSVGDWIWDSNAKGYYYDSEGQPLANTNGDIASGVQADDHAWQIINQKGVRVGGSAQTTGAIGVNTYPMKNLRVGMDWTMAANNYADFYLANTQGVNITQEVNTPWKAPWGNQFDLSANYRFYIGKTRLTVYGNINNLFNNIYIADSTVAADAANSWTSAYNVLYTFGRTYTVRLKFNF